MRRAAVATALVALLAAGAPAGGQDPPQTPNRPFAATFVSACLRAERPARVRALALDGTRLPRSVAAGHEPGTRPRCARDELRLLRFETLTIGGEPTYVRRGGCALPCEVRQATVHVPARAFGGRVRLLPAAARNGNGAPVDDCSAEVRAAPQRVGRALARMYYKTPAELRARRNAGRSGGAGATWANYGDPGATYRSPAGRRRHYTYLLWNLPRTAGGLLPGGGLVRAILRAGQPLALCPARLTLPAYDRRGAPNGSVDFAYARVEGEAQTLYGWVLLGYRDRARAYTSTTSGGHGPEERAVADLATMRSSPLPSRADWRPAVG